MSEKHLHIVAFNVPYPPDYGGIIDVFYKIKALYDLNIKIHLHCFAYGREDTGLLNQFCHTIYIYKRNTGWRSALSYKPYIVQSRQSNELMKNLLKDDHPVLFEGLHCCCYLGDKRLSNRIKIYRESNIEHRYYFNLFKIEKNVFRKTYFLSEAVKLYFFQKILKNVDFMFAVSEGDTNYLKRNFDPGKVYYLPSFHSNDEVNILPGRGSYALYHGDLSVPENHYACQYLIKKIFSRTDIPFVIAGRNPSARLAGMVSETSNIKLIANPEVEEMNDLITNAHVHILFTFQSTGLKLKLLNSLYRGRFHVVNSNMLAGTGLDDQCMVAENSWTVLRMLNEIMDQDFTGEMIVLRKQKLMERYNNRLNAEKLVGLIF